MTNSDNNSSGGAGGDKQKKSGVAEYLAAPRKKKKNFIVIAAGPSLNVDLAIAIESFIRATFKGYAVNAPKEPEELAKTFSKQVVLLIYDDQFQDLDKGLGLIKELKRKKNIAVPPVLFLTKQASTLITAYNKILLPYHESDDYIDWTRSSQAQVLAKVRTALVTRNARRTRRYRVDLPVEFFDKETAFMPHVDPPREPGVVLYYDSDKRKEIVVPPVSTPPSPPGRPGRLVDLSLHGCMLKSEDGTLFKDGNQISLKIPIDEYLPLESGQYLRISAKVQRVAIGGVLAGVSFENLSDRQLLTLTEFLSQVVNVQSQRRSTALKAKIAAQIAANQTS